MVALSHHVSNKYLLCCIKIVIYNHNFANKHENMLTHVHALPAARCAIYTYVVNVAISLQYH